MSKLAPYIWTTVVVSPIMLTLGAVYQSGKIDRNVNISIVDSVIPGYWRVREDVERKTCRCKTNTDEIELE